MKIILSRKPTFLFWALIFQLFIQGVAFSQSVLNYQGRVISGGTAFNGTGQFKFAIVSSDGATFYWKNDGTTTADAPTTAVSLPVSKGLFSVQLGDVSILNMGTIGSSILSNNGLKLRVWFNDGVKNWQQFTPDQNIISKTEVAINTDNGLVKKKNIFYGNYIFPGGWHATNTVRAESNGTLLGKTVFWKSSDDSAQTISGFQMDLNNQIPDGSKIIGIDIDCFDSVIETNSLTGSLKVDLIRINQNDGTSVVLNTVETGKGFKDGPIKISIDNLEIWNDGEFLYRLIVQAESKTNYYGVQKPNLSLGEMLRLDGVSVRFKK